MVCRFPTAQEADAALWCREALDIYGRSALHHAVLAPSEAQVPLIRCLVSGLAASQVLSLLKMSDEGAPEDLEVP